MIKEIWKPIEGYPDYEVSSMGRVKSLNYYHTGKEKILKENLKQPMVISGATQMIMNEYLLEFLI